MFLCILVYFALLSSCSVFSALVRNIEYSMESSYLFKAREKGSILFHVCPSLSSTQLYLCPVRSCSHFVHLSSIIVCVCIYIYIYVYIYSLPILELLFHCYLELGFLKIVVSDSRFRGLCLDSMSSMMSYIWARNRGILNWIPSV